MTQSESTVSLEALESTYKELSAYRDRLAADVLAMGRKLKLPPKMVDRNIQEHEELNRIAAVLKQLEEQIRNHGNHES